jgi:hypothetical protein
MIIKNSQLSTCLFLIPEYFKMFTIEELQIMKENDIIFKIMEMTNYNDIIVTIMEQLMVINNALPEHLEE